MILEFLQTYSVGIAIFLRVFSALISLFFCLPLQFEETRVKNGLQKLRWQLFAFGLIVFHIDVITIFILLPLLHTPQGFLHALAQVLNACFFVALSILGYKIYHTQYTEENKQRHEKIEELESHPN